MSNLTPQVTDAMLCAHSDGTTCASTASGHAASAIRQRASSATPSKWRDAIVEELGADKWIALRIFENDRTVWVWNHRDLGELVRIGDPVALHGLYDTLAVGAERISVLLAS
jgi:hypothetical protein